MSAPNQTIIPRKWTKDQVAFVMNHGPEHTNKDVADLFNVHFVGVSTITPEQVRRVRDKYAADPAYSGTSNAAIMNPNTGPPTGHASQPISTGAQQHAVESMHTSDDIDPINVIHGIGSTWHTTTHDDCPINGQHQHALDGTVKFPSAAALADAIQKTDARLYVDPSEADVRNLMAQMDEVTRHVGEDLEGRRD